MVYALSETEFALAQPLETVIGGKYEILQKVGEGGMGSIYKVRHRLLDEVRIVKVLRSQLAMDDTLQQRFQNEAKIAIRLRHPNIAHLYDFSVSDEGRIAFIVMEYIDGVTLQEMITKSGAPSLGLAVEIGSQFAKALSYLHSQGFVHRDIASDNLMLTTDFEGNPAVKLIDLGIAKGREQSVDLTATGIFMGKARYSPPEMFNSGGGASKLDERSDVYSFGVLLYELLTGEGPYDGDNFSEIVAGHLFRAPKPFEESDPDGRIPEDLRRLILQAIEKEPENRVESAAEIGRKLAEHAEPVESYRAEFSRALKATSQLQTLDPEPPTRGSTQNRLDREFGVGDPSSHDEVTHAAQLEAVTHAAIAIEERTKHGEVTNAEKDLELAVSLYGEHPEFHELRGKIREASLARRRSADLEPTAVAGQRAAAPGSDRSGPGRLVSPLGMAVLAAVLFLGAAGVWLLTRADSSPATSLAAAEAPSTALLVEAAPRWGTVAPLPSYEAELLRDAELAIPPPEDAPRPAPTRRTPTKPTRPPARETAQPRMAAPEPAAQARDEPRPAPPPSPRQPADGRGELFGPDPGVTPPALISLPPVTYPPGFKAPKDELYVMVEVLVGENGRVITARIAPRESAKRRFKDLALDEAKRATFRPATKDGVMGKMWTTIRVPLPGE